MAWKKIKRPPVLRPQQVRCPHCHHHVMASNFCSACGKKPGKFDMGTTTGTANTLETSYIKVTIDGKPMVEIDKYNYVCVINGVDYLKGSREALGLA